MADVRRKRIVMFAGAALAAALLGWGGWWLATERPTAAPTAVRDAGPHVPTPLISPRPIGPGTAKLSWDEPAPQAHLSHDSLDRIAGYRIYVGRQPDALRLEAQLADPSATGYVVQRLPRGTSWFSVTTYSRLGVESDRPAPVAKVVR